MTHGAGRSAGGERADLRARLVSQGEGTLCGATWAAALCRVGPAGPRGVLAGLESAAYERLAVGSSGRGGRTRAAARRKGR